MSSRAMFETAADVLLLMGLSPFQAELPGRRSLVTTRGFVRTAAKRSLRARVFPRTGLDEEHVVIPWNTRQALPFLSEKRVRAHDFMGLTPIVQGWVAG